MLLQVQQMRIIIVRPVTFSMTVSNREKQYKYCLNYQSDAEVWTCCYIICLLRVLPILWLNDHPPHLENQTLRSGCRQESQMLKAEKCGWLGGQHTCTFFCSPRLQDFNFPEFYFSIWKSQDSSTTGNLTWHLAWTMHNAWWLRYSRHDAVQLWLEVQRHGKLQWSLSYVLGVLSDPTARCGLAPNND